MQDSPRPPSPSPRPIHTSTKVVVALQSYRQARDEGASQRDAAAKADLPRSTLRDLDCVGKRHGIADERDALVRSPSGFGLVTDVVDAGLLVFCIGAGVGLPTFRRFLEYAKLAPYVASSPTALQERLRALEDAFVKECDDERAILATQMPEPASVVVGLDETFFGSRTCLVAADLLTGFLLVETFAEARDRAAWKEVWKAETRGLALKVEHAVADGARGIQAFVEDDLGAFRAPDLFHVMHDIGKAFACHLARRQRRAEDREEDVREVYAGLEEFELRRGEAPPRRGRPMDVKGRKAQARGYIASASREVLVAKERREEFRAVLAALSAAYLPVSIQTGELKPPEWLRREFDAIIACLRDIAKASCLGEHHEAYLSKAERCLPEMVDSLAHFHGQVAAEITRRKLAPGEQEALTRYLVPSALLRERGRNAATAQERGALRETSERLLGQASEALGIEVTSPLFHQLMLTALELSALWQRTTSSIEGRNGTLSQRHHARRGLNERKLRCSTHVHNFFIRRSDGTTAAERFFGRGHRDVARAALDGMGDLKRPRYSRQAA